MTEMNMSAEAFLPRIAVDLGHDISNIRSHWNQIRKLEIERWGGGTVEPAVAEILYIYAKILKPRQILELGTNVGYSTLHLALGADNGTVVATWDINRDYILAARQQWEKYLVNDKIHTFIGDTTTQDFATWLKREKLIDLVFVDSSHIYAATKKELSFLFQYLRKGTIVILHDIFNESVEKAVNEFDWSWKNEYDTQPNTGLGVRVI